jgi:hypothetical protein
MALKVNCTLVGSRPVRLFSSSWAIFPMVTEHELVPLEQSEPCIEV